MSSGFFPAKGSEDKQFIPPDYSDVKDEEEIPYDSDLSGDDDDEDDDLDTDEDIENEEKIEELEQTKKQSVTMTPFGNPQQPTSSWKPTGWNWGAQGQQQSTTPSDFWSNPGGNNNPSNGWGQPGSTWGKPSTQAGQQNQQIDRTKKVVFIDFFDGLMETYQSQGQPGFIPRAVYDLKPRFEVWNKIIAFSPERVYGLAQKEFLNDINGIEGWTRVLEGWCCCISSFLRKPYTCTQILLSTSIYQPKDDLIMTTLAGGLKKEDCIYVGLNSGLYNQSNQDFMTAQNCGIDYLDLGQLLNNMY
ncbi:MAG: hypothetical protein J6I84_03945 [Bacilli bacterium]|nr:hypothetical protein [Bacilli bacterium]